MKVLSAILLLFLLLFPGCKKEVENNQPLFIMRYADNQNAKYPTIQAAKYFAALVKTRTHGEIAIEIYPEGLLGTEYEVLEQMHFGGVDISRFSLGSLSKQIPSLNVLQLPFLYKDRDHMWRVLDSDIGSFFISEIEKEEFEYLCWFDAGSRSFYSIMPITTPEDLSGRKIRVQESSIKAKLISLLGAEAVTIPFENIYSALKQGIIDGAENNFPTYMFNGHYQEAKYYYLDEHFRVPEVVLMSKNAKEKIEEINPKYLEIIKQCALETSEYEKSLWIEVVEQMKSGALLAGCEITIPNEKDIALLKEKMMPIYDELDERSKEIIKTIKALE